jgi:hypothetical protein
MTILHLWTLSIVRNSKEPENTTSLKLDLFLSSGEGRESPTLSGPLERANLWTQCMSLTLPKRPNRVGVSLP